MRPCGERSIDVEGDLLALGIDARGIEENAHPWQERARGRHVADAEADAHQVIDLRLDDRIDVDVHARQGAAEIDRQFAVDQSAAELEIEGQQSVRCQHQFDVMEIVRLSGQDLAVVVVLEGAEFVVVGDDEGEQPAGAGGQRLETVVELLAYPVEQEFGEIGTRRPGLQPVAETLALPGGRGVVEAAGFIAENAGTQAAQTASEVVEWLAADQRNVDRVDAVGSGVERREETLKAREHLGRVVEQRQQRGGDVELENEIRQGDTVVRLELEAERIEIEGGVGVQHVVGAPVVVAVSLGAADRQGLDRKIQRQVEFGVAESAGLEGTAELSEGQPAVAVRVRARLVEIDHRAERDRRRAPLGDQAELRTADVEAQAEVDTVCGRRGAGADAAVGSDVIARREDIAQVEAEAEIKADPGVEIDLRIDFDGDQILEREAEPVVEPKRAGIDVEVVVGGDAVGQVEVEIEGRILITQGDRIDVGAKSEGGSQFGVELGFELVDVAGARPDRADRVAQLGGEADRTAAEGVGDADTDEGNIVIKRAGAQLITGQVGGRAVGQRDAALRCRSALVLVVVNGVGRRLDPALFIDVDVPGAGGAGFDAPGFNSANLPLEEAGLAVVVVEDELRLRQAVRRRCQRIGPGRQRRTRGCPLLFEDFQVAAVQLAVDHGIDADQVVEPALERGEDHVERDAAHLQQLGKTVDADALRDSVDQFLETGTARELFRERRDVGGAVVQPGEDATEFDRQIDGVIEIGVERGLDPVGAGVAKQRGGAELAGQPDIEAGVEVDEAVIDADAEDGDIEVDVEGLAQRRGKDTSGRKRRRIASSVDQGQRGPLAGRIVGADRRDLVGDHPAVAVHQRDDVIDRQHGRRVAIDLEDTGIRVPGQRLVVRGRADVDRDVKTIVTDREIGAHARVIDEEVARRVESETEVEVDSGTDRQAVGTRHRETEIEG